MENNKNNDNGYLDFNINDDNIYYIENYQEILNKRK